MPDPAEQLARLYAAGFEIQTFDRIPSALGLVREDCIALYEPSPEGLKPIGRPGWKLGEIIGVLTTVGGRQVFQAKSEIVEATPERLEKLRQFESEIQAHLAPPA